MSDDDELSCIVCGGKGSIFWSGEDRPCPCQRSTISDKIVTEDGNVVAHCRAFVEELAAAQAELALAELTVQGVDGPGLATKINTIKAERDRLARELKAAKEIVKSAEDGDVHYCQPRKKWKQYARVVCSYCTKSTPSDPLDVALERAVAAEKRVADLEAHFNNCGECSECLFESGTRMPPVHFARVPFHAVCGADIPNQSTAAFMGGVTCAACIAVAGDSLDTHNGEKK